MWFKIKNTVQLVVVLATIVKNTESGRIKPTGEKLKNEGRNIEAGGKDGDAFTSSCISVASVRDGWLVRASRVASRAEEKGWKGREEEKGCERDERERETGGW